MPYQVAALCYASPDDAARATCSAMVPEVRSDGSGSSLEIVSTSCAGVLGDGSGGFLVHISAEHVGSGVVTSYDRAVYPVYPDCTHQDYVDAAAVLFAAVLGVWVVVWAGKKMLGLLNWSRGDQIN